MSASSVRLQDYYPPSFHDCFGCGRNNPDGLKLETHAEGDEVVCDWQPERRLQGAASVLHGGIISLLMDEVAGAAAFVEYHRATGAPLGTLERFDFVTANMSIDYLAPVLVTDPLQLRARVTKVERRKVIVSCDLWTRGNVASRGTLLFVSIPPERRVPSASAMPC